VKRSQVWMVVALVMLMVVPALGQEFYSPTPAAVAQPSRNPLRGLPVRVVVRLSAPWNTYYMGDFQSVAEDLILANGGSVDYTQNANILEVVVSQFQVKALQSVAVSHRQIGLATSGFKISTKGHVRLIVRGQVVRSVPFSGSDTAKGLALSYGQGGQVQLPATGGYSGGYGQGYGYGYPQAFTPGGVALDATGQAGVYINGQWVQSGQTYDNAMPMGYGGVAPTYAQGGVAQSSLNGAGYYTPNGVWVQPGANGAAFGNYNSNAAPQKGSIAIASQEMPDAENAIRKALEPAIKKLAQGR